MLEAEITNSSFDFGIDQSVTMDPSDYPIKRGTAGVADKSEEHQTIEGKIMDSRISGIPTPDGPDIRLVKLPTGKYGHSIMTMGGEILLEDLQL